MLRWGPRLGLRQSYWRCLQGSPGHGWADGPTGGGAGGCGGGKGEEQFWFYHLNSMGYVKRCH